MKRNATLLLVILTLVSSHLIQTRIGCLTKSKELKQAFDTKAYHPVACNCQCDLHKATKRTHAARNKCLECSHFHDPEPLILVTKIIKTTFHKPYFTHTPQETMQLLIDRYRANKNPR